MSTIHVVRGMSWAVQDSGGPRPALVFLPGTLGSVGIFRHQVKAFSGGYRTVVLGYPGTSNLDQLTESFWALLDELGVEAPHLVGSSLGAYLLQRFTCTEALAAKASGLLLGNTFVNSHRLRFIRMFDPGFVDQASPAEVKAQWLAFVEALPVETLRSALLPMVRDQQSDAELYGRSLAIAHLGAVRLSQVTPKRLVLLSCVNDPVSHESVASEVAASYPDARHIRLSAGAHYPHLINAAAYNDALSSALL